MKKPVVINLYGSEGCGKEAAAQYLYDKLKKRYSIALVSLNENPSDYTRVLCSGLETYYDIIITTTPLLRPYKKWENLTTYEKNIQMTILLSFYNLNFFIVRPPEILCQNIEEYDEAADKLQMELDDWNIKYSIGLGREEYFRYIEKEVLNFMEENFKYG